MVAASLADEAGGVAAAVRCWSRELAATGVSVSLLCLKLDRLFGINRIEEAPNLEVIEVPCQIQSRMRYVRAPSLASVLSDLCRSRRPDVIHANGVWLPGTRVAAAVSRRTGIPLIVSPHGHLQHWALSHKRLKKTLAWSVYGKRSLSSATILQAASSLEADSIRALNIGVPVTVVPNIVDFPDEVDKVKIEKEPNTALFLSRIHPSKGIMELVHAWNHIRDRDWKLLIAGNDEIGYQAAVEREVQRLGLDDQIGFLGPVAYSDRWNVYRRASLFVLPTHSENFGITVGEALACGIPVITTRAAPWPVLETHRCGWWVDGAGEGLREALTQAVALPQNELAAMGDRGSRLVMNRYSRQAVVEQLVAMYRSVANGSGSGLLGTEAQ